MARKLWTTEEIKLLKELYPNTPSDEIAKKLNRSMCCYAVGLLSNE